MRCSNRWSNPVLPGSSFFEPTWYQTLTATIGALRSVWTTTVRPFARVNFSYGISSPAAGMGIATDVDTPCAAPATGPDRPAPNEQKRSEWHLNRRPAFKLRLSVAKKHHILRVKPTNGPGRKGSVPPAAAGPDLPHWTFDHDYAENCTVELCRVRPGCGDGLVVSGRH